MEFGYVNKIVNRPADTQEADLKAVLPPGSKIWRVGRGEENLAALLKAGRGRNIPVNIAADLRVFGSSRADILQAVHRIQDAGFTIRDIHNKEDSLPIMLDRVLRELASYARFRGSKKTAKVTGRRGGNAKGEAMRARRFGNIDEETARRVWIMPGATVQWKIWALGEGFTEATCRRMFGPVKQLDALPKLKPAKKRKRK